MADLPTSVGYMTVTGRLVLGYADSNDAGSRPDMVSGVGTVTFAPDIQTSFPLVSIPDTLMIAAASVKCALDGNGVIVPPSDGADSDPVNGAAPGVNLIAPLQPGVLSNTDWTWTATFTPAVGQKWKAFTRTFTGAPGDVVDIATLIPVPSSPGAELVAWQAAVTATTTARDEAVAAAANTRTVAHVGPATGTDTAAINAALTEAADGGLVIFDGDTYTTTGGHIIPPGVTVLGYGATIVHTGDNVCFTGNQTGTFNISDPAGVRGLRIQGNTGTNAVGVEVGNCWGFHIDGDISGYTNGRGVLLNNVTNWTEGVDIDSLKIDGCAVGVQFRRTTGTFSFGYTRIRHLAINVPANGTGIDIGGDSTDTVYLYNSDIEANIWVHGDNATGVRVSAVVNTDNLRVNIVGEIPGGATYAGVSGLKNEGGTFKAYGRIHIKGTTDNIALGYTRVLAAGPATDGMSGTNGGDTFQAWLAANEDVSHNAQYGYIYGTNRSIPYVAGYAGGDAFRVYSIPNNGTPATGTKVFSIDGNGYVEFPNAATWNLGGIRMGNNTLWLDGTGRLRIKAGYPSSDTDGTIVGTQS